jgi:hypothetical protein
MLLFDTEGNLQTIWISSVLKGGEIEPLSSEEFRQECSELVRYLKDLNIRLCGTNGMDFSHDIIKELEKGLLTDVIIETENSKYKAIAIATLNESKYLKIEYLCSIAKGGGSSVIERIKDVLNDHDRKGLQAKKIILEPTPTSFMFYYKMGFKFEASWGGHIEKSGGNRKTRRRQTRRRR